MHQYKVIYKNKGFDGKAVVKQFVINVNSDSIKFFKKVGYAYFLLGYSWDYKSWFDLFRFKFICKSYIAENYSTGETIEYSRLS
ncbi:MAG: hypothetical protein WCS51_04030 [Bacilli bacterium]